MVLDFFAELIPVAFVDLLGNGFKRFEKARYFFVGRDAIDEPAVRFFVPNLSRIAPEFFRGGVEIDAVEFFHKIVQRTDHIGFLFSECRLPE